MYYRSFFCKENAFNVVFFLAIFIFATIKFVWYSDELVHISLALSILITALSVLDLFIKSLEKIITDQSQNISDEYHYLSKKYNENGCNINFKEIISIKNKNEFIDYLESKKDMLLSMSDDDYDIKCLKIYWEVLQVRKKFRMVRKILLFFYYVILLFIIVLLMFSTNVSEILKDIKQPDLTIWSFIIILFDVLLSKPLNASIYNGLSKYYNKKANTLSQTKEKF